MNKMKLKHSKIFVEHKGSGVNMIVINFFNMAFNGGT
jgi:hypothetical protein